MHQIDKVWRFAFIDARKSQMQGLCLGGFGLLLGDCARFNHGIENKVAALNGAVGVAEWIQATGALDETGEQRAFRQAGNWRTSLPK